MNATLRIARAIGVTAAAIAAAAALSTPAFAANDAGRHQAPVFVQSDDLSGNTVVAYDRAGDGSLRQAGVYATGGLGGRAARLGRSPVGHQSDASRRACRSWLATFAVSVPTTSAISGVARPTT
ncbi:hypothetical protein GCM10009665_74880 [Kitasatospora nipponensis]|uniref:Uncharacterized protein n=1 Tax=Kitasatospora nipponensis TaxID=258049 RepID=A0ABN1T7Y0_9ACTN